MNRRHPFAVGIERNVADAREQFAKSYLSDAGSFGSDDQSSLGGFTADRRRSVFVFSAGQFSIVAQAPC